MKIWNWFNLSTISLYFFKYLNLKIHFATNHTPINTLQIQNVYVDIHNLYMNVFNLDAPQYTWNINQIPKAEYIHQSKQWNNILENIGKSGIHKLKDILNQINLFSTRDEVINNQPVKVNPVPPMNDHMFLMEKRYVC